MLADTSKTKPPVLFSLDVTTPSRTDDAVDIEPMLFAIVRLEIISSWSQKIWSDSNIVDNIFDCGTNAGFYTDTANPRVDIDTRYSRFAITLNSAPVSLMSGTVYSTT